MKSYMVHLSKVAYYFLDLEVEAETEEEAEEKALSYPDLDLMDWDYSHPGCDLEAAQIDCLGDVDDVMTSTGKGSAD